MGAKTNKELFWDDFVKVLKEQHQFDVQLKACDTDKDAVISAHKLLLSARSEVFKNMLELDKFKASSKMETITLSEMKHEELEALVEFIYSDGSLLSEKGKQYVKSLYTAADKYVIPHLRDLCRKQLLSSLSHSNALDVLVIAETPLDKSLFEAAVTTLRDNFSTISGSAKFKDFLVNHPDLTVEILKTFEVKPTCFSHRSCHNCYH